MRGDDVRVVKLGWSCVTLGCLDMDALIMVLIVVGLLVGLIFCCVVGMLVACVDLLLDCFDDVVLVVDLIVARVFVHVLHGIVDVAFEFGLCMFLLCVGLLRLGGGDVFVVDVVVLGVGNVIEQFVDELRVLLEGECEFLHVRFEYVGAGV